MHRVTIRPELVAAVLLGIVVVLVVFHFIGHYHSTHVGSGVLTYSFAPKFNLDGEQTVPAFYTSLMLMFVSLILAAIAHDSKTVKYKYHWWVLAAIFAFMAFDEASGFHELLTMPMRNRLDLPRWLRFAWVIPAAVVVLIFALSYLKFVLHLPRKCSLLFVAAGVTYVTGALGMEVLGADASSRFAYQVFMSTEETMEMVGVIIFIYATLKYKALLGNPMQVLIHHVPEDPASLDK
jgi:hypothetical protein